MSKDETIIELLELLSLNAHSLHEPVDHVIVDSLRVLVRQEILSARVVHHEDQMVLVLHYFMLVVINDVQPVEHTVICLHKDLVSVLIDPQLIDLGPEHNQLQLGQVVKVESGRQEKHGVSPPELGAQCEVSHDRGRDGNSCR